MNCQLYARTIPAALVPFSEPTLIPGESYEEYEALRGLLIEDVDPQSNIEWLWLLDLTELTWEILRYRKLKARVTSMYRSKAIEAMLLRLDGPGIERSPMLKLQTKRNAVDWQCDSEAASEIETRLKRAGFDSAAMNAEVYLQARDAIALFDALIHAAQSRRNALLREIGESRSFSLRVKQLQWKAVDRYSDVDRNYMSAVR